MCHVAIKNPSITNQKHSRQHLKQQPHSPQNNSPLPYTNGGLHLLFVNQCFAESFQFVAHQFYLLRHTAAVTDYLRPPVRRE